MDNLGITIGSLLFRGSPKISDSYSPIPFTGAALNAILVLISFAKLVKYGGRSHTQIFIASVIGTVCCILYFGVNTENGGGFIVLNTLYHSLIWLSCISLFPKYVKITQGSGVLISVTAANIFTYLAYLWFLLSASIAIVAETTKEDFTFYFFSRQHYYAGDSVITFARLFQFICHCNWFYVLCLLILLCNYLPTFNKVSEQFQTPLISFFLLSTIAVITDTAIVASGENLQRSDPTSILVLSLIFVQFFNFLSACIILTYSKRWITLIEESKKESLPS